MLDYSASAKLVPLSVMTQLGLETTRPYINICVMDFKEVNVHGLIKDLKVDLLAYLDISTMMDVMVIENLDVYGIFLSTKWH